jgi:hypothetical protein
MAAVSPPKPAPTITTLMPVLDFVSVFGMSLVLVMVRLGRLLKVRGSGAVASFLPHNCRGIGNFAADRNRKFGSRIPHGEYARPEQ